MRVYRLCSRSEAETILRSRNFKDVGHQCEIDFTKNTHEYIKSVNYMHFFEEEIDLLYLYPTRGNIICVYDIPDSILDASIGKGFYYDFINLQVLEEVIEYAIESDKIEFQYLEKVYVIDIDLDFDYFPKAEELYDSLNCIYDSTI